MAISETAPGVRPSWPPADTKGSLQGKVALITGGASGIGRATATLFAREGAAVVVVDRNETGGQTVVEAIAREGGRALFEGADVTKAVDCQHVVERTARELGGLHILVNNAGIIRRATVLELSEAEWDQVMSVREIGFSALQVRCSADAPRRWGLDHQHCLRLGTGGRFKGGGLLRLQGSCSAADQSDGHRPRR